MLKDTKVLGVLVMAPGACMGVSGRDGPGPPGRCTPRKERRPPPWIAAPHCRCLRLAAFRALPIGPSPVPGQDFPRGRRRPGRPPTCCSCCSMTWASAPPQPRRTRAHAHLDKLACQRPALQPLPCELAVFTDARRAAPGRNDHEIGFGTVVEGASGYPGYNSVWPKSAVSIAKC